MFILRRNLGFSLMEVMMAMGITAFLVMAFGGFFSQTFSSEISMRSKLEVSLELQAVQHRLNSVEWFTAQYNRLRENIEDVSPTDLVEFDRCAANRANPNCTKFLNAAIYDQLDFTETFPVNRDASVQVRWVSSLTCTNPTCTEFGMAATITMTAATPEYADGPLYKQMLHKLRQQTASPAKSYPISLLLPKQDVNYSCANDPANGLIQGIDPDAVAATCGVMQGRLNCADAGLTPVEQFGLDELDPNGCQPLVNLGCAWGLSDGGLWDGTCAPDKPNPIMPTYGTVDPNTGELTEYVVCSPAGSDCLRFYRNPTSAFWSNINFQSALDASRTFDQLIATWMLEGTLVDNEINRNMYGPMLDANGVPTGVYLEVIPSNQVSQNGNYSNVTVTHPPTQFTQPNLDPGIFAGP